MYNLEVLSPEKVYFEGKVSFFSAIGGFGSFGVLTNHAPLISTIKSGKIIFTDENGKHYLYEVAEGVFEVYRNKAFLLVDKVFSVKEVKDLDFVQV